MNQENQSTNIVYCGGRFDFDYLDEGYVQKAAQDYRAVLLQDVNLLLGSPGPIQLSGRMTYIGPFYFETDGMLDQDIVEAEKRQIEKCTLALFLLDDSPCPGTVAEMVYAASLHKKMAVVYIRNENETESALQSSCWYPIILCQKLSRTKIDLIPYADHSEGQRKAVKYLQEMMFDD